MISARKVPKSFWPEAVNWATYLMNRSPTFSVKDMTPEEAWSGRKPSVSHFRVFGCLAHVHIPDSQRKKLDSKSKKCVLLGVSDVSKAYKLYDPIDKKIITSRDVVFEESKEWEWNKLSQTQSIDNDDWSNDEAEDDSVHEDIAVEPVNEVDENTADNSEDEDMIISNNTSDSEGNSDGITQLAPRIRKPPRRLDIYVTGREAEEERELHNLAIYSTIKDLNTYDEAMKLDVWRVAMDAEMDSIKRNNTWELTLLPDG
ncbi:equilibrative nucleoside transporter 3-like protein, partial [Trifolium pratense]